MSMTQCQGGVDDTSDLQAELFHQERERLARKGQPMNKIRILTKLQFLSINDLVGFGNSLCFLVLLNDEYMSVIYIYMYIYTPKCSLGRLLHLERYDMYDL